ncbi:hypothetical protein [Rhizobium leguminosarum]|uniref:hypothetical protein n=1 Tax=Rhizobium leguminosarum TaxID=384 RepID=UPI000568874E|nr:hypothetical protein [Rhizobium leguminosarum]
MTKDVLNDDDGDRAGFDLGFATRAILGGQATRLAPAGTRARTIPLCGRLIDDHDRIGSSSTKQEDISIAANAGLSSNLGLFLREKLTWLPPERIRRQPLCPGRLGESEIGPEGSGTDSRSCPQLLSQCRSVLTEAAGKVLRTILAGRRAGRR